MYSQLFASWEAVACCVSESFVRSPVATVVCTCLLTSRACDLWRVMTSYFVEWPLFQSFLSFYDWIRFYTWGRDAPEVTLSSPPCVASGDRCGGYTSSLCWSLLSNLLDLSDPDISELMSTVYKRVLVGVFLLCPQFWSRCFEAIFFWHNSQIWVDFLLCIIFIFIAVLFFIFFFVVCKNC